MKSRPMKSRMVKNSPALGFLCAAVGTVLLASAAAAQGLSAGTPAREYIYVGGRLIAVETPVGNGTAAAPFATITEWSRGDLSQFSILDVGTNSVKLTPVLRTTQPDSSYSVLPDIEWTVTAAAGPSHQYLLTKQAYAPTGEEDLVIEADIAYSVIDQITGFGCFDPNSPTSNYYLLGKTTGGIYRLRKSIGGTLYTQAQDSVAPESTAIKGQKARIRFVLTKAGGVRVYNAGNVLFEVPMTLGNPTVLSACRPGFVVTPWSVQSGGGLAFSRLRVFRMKPDGEQMF